MTGYWMTPSAWTLPTGTMALAMNSHFNDSVFNRPQNLLFGVSPFAHAEGVGRFAFRDLSWNLKLGASLWDSSWHRTGVAVGMQDFWGGQRFFHSNYVVGTQRIGPLEASVGWGGGPAVHEGYRRTPRLDGWFWGGQLDALPADWPWQLSLLHDDDGWQSHTGARVEWMDETWGVALDASRAWEQRRWDFGVQVQTVLPQDRPVPSRNSGERVHLRFGPWMQTFLGTEIGDLDIQAAVEAVGLAVPVEDAWVGVRVRDLVYSSTNFKPGKAFAPYRQDPELWLEGVALGWGRELSTGTGAWMQAGVVDGSWTGGLLEMQAPLLLSGVRVGGQVGGWHSSFWHSQRWVALPGIEWMSKTRRWQANMDVGRFWGQDEGMRLGLGRRFGRVMILARTSRTNRELMAEGRMELELDGLGWNPVRWLVLEPTPRWGHGSSTRISMRHGDPNWIRVGLAKDPPLMVRGRDGSWP